MKREYFASPFLSQERLDAIRKMDEHLKSLPATEQPRFTNALRWYDLGTRTQGIECFVNLWVSLEALVL